MIRTLRVGNNNVAQTGRLQIQPTNVQNDRALNDDKNQRYADLSAAVTPIAVGQANYDSVGKAYTSVTKSDLTTMIHDAINTDAIMTSMKGTNIGNVSPSTAIDASNIRVAIDLNAPAKKIESYEALTGISQERPEVVMITEFAPLFRSSISSDNAYMAQYTDDDVHALLTDAGKFFDVQADLRLIKTFNINKMLERNKSRSQKFLTTYNRQKASASANTQVLQSYARYLSNVVQMLEKLKRQLDIREQSYTVDPQIVLRDHVAEHGTIVSPQLITNASEAITTSFHKNYGVVDVLQLFNFGASHINHEFSSTKVWLQTLLEMKALLETHTLALFDIKSNQNKLDSSASKIAINSDVKRFSFVLTTSVKPIDVLQNTQPSDITQTCAQLVSAYDELYKRTRFRSNEMKIASLLNATSQEYRYSRGLSLQSVQQALLKNHQYKVADTNNLGVFNAIIGDVGKTIDDVAYTQTNTLISIAQQRVGDIVVLPLESKYIEGSFGTLTPGSSYIVDSVFDTDGKKFNTSHMDQYCKLLATMKQSFNTIVSGMNLISYDDTEKFSNVHSLASTSFNNSSKLFSLLSEKFVASNGTPTQLVKNDVTTPIFAMANSDPQIKALLLLLLVMRLTKANGRTNMFMKNNVVSNGTSTITSIIDALFDRMIANVTPLSLAKLTKTSKTFTPTISMSNTGVISDKRTNNATKVDTTILNVGEMRSALKMNSTLMQTVEDILNKVMTIFKDDNAALNGTMTRYSGIPDTTLLMAVFDIITTIIDTYGNCHVVGVQTSALQESFLVQRKYDNHGASIKEILSRANNETVTAQHTIFFVLNTMNCLLNSMTNVLNYLNGNNSITQLQSIAEMLGNDVTLLRYALSDQQIKLFANTVADIVHDSTVANDAAVVIYDDASMSHESRDAFDAVMMSPQFTEINGSDYRILTVGIPLGFSHHLQQKINASDITRRSSFDEQQNDIVSINVYKVDIENPDIIYKPQKFLFELSRFPARGSSFVKADKTIGKKLFDSIRRFATRDGDQVFSEGGTAVQYINSQKGEIEALSDKSYSFLSQQAKESLYTNHVMSYLLNIYIKIMTGFSTADADFDLIRNQKLVDPTFLDALLNSDINEVASSTSDSSSTTSGNGLFFDFMTPTRSKSVDLLSSYTKTDAIRTSSARDVDYATVLASLGKRHAGRCISSIVTTNEFAWTPSSLSSPELHAPKLLRPKQFDRVFNVMVDRHAFEIDTEQTFSTPMGKQAFQLLLDGGDIQASNTQTTLSTTSTNAFILRRKSVNDGDASLEKYIVAVETVGETEV